MVDAVTSADDEAGAGAVVAVAATMVVEVVVVVVVVVPEISRATPQTVWAWLTMSVESFWVS